MATQELLDASDDLIDDMVNYVDPIVLRGLLYQLTGDESIGAIPHSNVMMGFRGENPAIVDPEHVALLRARAADILKAHRDAATEAYSFGPAERLHRSMELAVGAPIADAELDLWIEQMALDPMVRAFDWRQRPNDAVRSGFLVAVIGAGMGGLNAAMQLKRAGIPFVVIEKNGQVGGTWHENRYPGARVDTMSRTYFHAFGIDFQCPNPFCAQEVNETYFNWVADKFDLRDDIAFNSEVKSIVWDDDAKFWEISAVGPDGPRSWRANAVISCVGFLNRPNTPEIEGADSFAGEIIHTARWPKDVDLAGKRVAVIGSGATSYQMVPELAGKVDHLTLFQRTPSWCIEVPGYLASYPPQVTWLDRNFPFMVNFLRLQMSWLTRPDNTLEMVAADPDYRDPHAVSAPNKKMREQCLAFMQRKFGNRMDLMEKMVPIAPPMSSRPVLVDSDNNIYDALLRDNVDLVADPIARITPGGLQTEDGKDYSADVIVYATGFKANEFLWPMDLRGRSGQTIAELWAKDGARAYIGTMMPGFPNFFMIYGPNMNPFGNGLGVVEMEEMATRFAMKCIEALILGDRRAVDVTRDGYDRFNAELDRLEATKVYADYRVTNYYKNDYGRSAVNNPFDVRLLWNWWREPARREGVIAAESDSIIRPYIGADLIVD